MGFSGAKIAPCPPYTPLGTIESSKGLRPSRALRGFFDSLKRRKALARGRRSGGGRRVLLALCPSLLWGTRPKFPQTKNPAAPIYGGWVRVLPAVNLRHVRRFEESGNSNLWFPDSCSIRRQQVEPGTARPTDKNNSGYKCRGLILGARVAIIETNLEIKECTNYASCYYQGDVREGL